MPAEVEFSIQLARSGRVVPVGKAQSVLEALQACGVDIATSCQQGVCGTCVTRVLAGEPDHWDMYLTPEEQAANNQFCPCVSRSRSEVLVLDL